MTSNKTINAEFTLNTRTIIASEGGGWLISSSGAVSVVYGAAQGFIITAVSGYHIFNVFVDGGSVGPVCSNPFTNVVTGHIIVAYFEINP